MAQIYSSSWFNSDSNSATYLNTIRDCQENNYKNGYLKIKIIKTPDFNTIIKKNNKEDLDISEIPQDSWFKSILQIYALWVKPNNEFGLYLRPIIISFKIPENLFVYQFIESDEDDIPDTEINNNDLFIKKEDIEQSYLTTSILNIDNSSFDDSTTSS